MSRRKELSTSSAGVPWEDVPEHALADVEWMDGRHGPGEDKASVEEFPVPSVLLTLPDLHPKRPRGSKAMIDAHGAKRRLGGLRPGAWLLSPFTGWKWAVLPSGNVSWVPPLTDLPDTLRVDTRNDIN